MGKGFQDIIVVTTLIILSITIIPLLIGIGLAMLFGVVGGMFYIVVLLTASIIWGILSLIWWM